MLNVLGNRSTTEYRRFYNEPTPFHRNTKLYKLRNLQLKPTPEEKYSSWLNIIMINFHIKFNDY